LLDAGFNIGMLAQRQAHRPQALAKRYAEARPSADRKRCRASRSRRVRPLAAFPPRVEHPLVARVGGTRALTALRDSERWEGRQPVTRA
jgi:hypothetical protein